MQPHEFPRCGHFFAARISLCVRLLLEELLIMNIKITSDSTCDLTRDYLDAHGVDILPLYINLGGKSYRDSVDIVPEDIYRHVSAGGDISKTAAVNVEDYEACFSRYSTQYDAVVHINLGAEFSSCHQNARIAAEAYPNVYPVDSCNLSSGHGQVVMEAVALAEAGLEPAEIAARLQSFVSRVDASFLLNQLEYLHLGGRCSTVAALGANLLKLKPCIEVQDGKMRVGKKYRGAYEKALLEYTRDRLSGPQARNARRILVVSTACPPELVDMVCAEVERLTGQAPTARPLAGCTIASHCGPSTIGIMFVQD
ncbi:DegV domain-containing protein [bioreactor metagenome]|uniref:DegV domain-containing protein n=1 Tax=bioreactor metagenome TaxID=1076179 RepID=A0A645A4L4_9ZZZZ